jgi:proline iminopeptidase
MELWRRPAAAYRLARQEHDEDTLMADTPARTVQAVGSDAELMARYGRMIADHRELYLRDGAAGHMWDSTVAGGSRPLPTLLLFTTGRKSGAESIMPLLYTEVDGGGYGIVASKGGAPHHPGWYHNLRAQPEVKVKVRDDVFRARHRIAAGAERQAIWDRLEASYPPLKAYKAATTREIPIVVLEPIR